MLPTSDRYVSLVEQLEIPPDPDPARFYYASNCVACGDGAAVTAMTESAFPVSYRAFRTSVV